MPSSAIDSQLIAKLILSHSCKLAVRWVEPDYLPFEPTDTVIIDKDTYRDYKVALQRPKVRDQSDTPDISVTTFFQRHDDDSIPCIDLVCHRLTMKWEPIFNIVHRYIFCRCVVRLSYSVASDGRNDYPHGLAVPKAQLERHHFSRLQ